MPIQMFDDGHEEFQQSVKSFGEAVGGLLKQRLHKKQFEDFLAGPTKEFRDSMTQAQDLLMDDSNPEAAAQGMQMLKSSLESYMDEGARYSDNPIIQQRVAQTFKVNMDFLNMEFKSKFDAQKNEREAAEAKQKAEAHGVEMGLKRSTTALNLAKAGKEKAAGEKEAEGSEPQLFSGRPGSIEPMQKNEELAKELWTRIETAIDRPNSEAQRKAVEFGMEDIRNQMASQRLAEMAGRGEIKPKGTGVGEVDRPWDVFSAEDKAAVAGTIDPVEVRNRFIMEKAKAEGSYHGIKPELMEAQYGVVVDPTKANAFRPLDRAVSSENLGKIMFGVAGWDRLRDEKSKARPKNLAEAIERLPADVNEAQGPIAQKFKEFALPEGIDPASLKSPEDVKALLGKQGYDLVTAIIGDNASSTSLDAGMRENRLEAMKLVTAMVEKYAEQVFTRVTGKVKKQEGKTEAQAAKDYPILGHYARRAGQAERVVRGILKNFTED